MSFAKTIDCKGAPNLTIYGFRKDLFYDVLEAMAKIQFPRASTIEILNEKMPIILNALFDQMDENRFIVSRSKKNSEKK